jgi:hypothetical protein
MNHEDKSFALGLGAALAFIVVSAVLLISTAGAENFSSVPVTAPVVSVNGLQGAVVVPTLCRQQTATPLAIPTTNPGVVSWTFPNTNCSFASPPSCWMDMATSTSGYVFDFPLNTARSTTSVSYSFTAHSNTVSVSIVPLSITLSLAPPSNSTVIMTCTAPPA